MKLRSMQVKHPARSRRGRRGLSILEVMIAGSIMLVTMIAITSFSTFSARAWQNGMSDTTSEMMASLALQRMAPTIRAARSVVTGSSSATRLTLQMPAYDASGNLTIPLTNGQVISYYLSDSSGSTTARGDILWRSVDGTPDSAWSMRGSVGRVQLSTGGLGFTFYPTSDPESVTVTVTASKTVGTKTSTFATTQEVLLRNKGL